MQRSKGAEPSRRLIIHRLDPEDNRADFAGDVRNGLCSNPKRLSPKYFYDELGSHLFEAICYLPEYYLTRAEAEILATNADEIVSECDGSAQRPMRLIELGSGSAVKTRFLIEALLRFQPELHYIPVDISALSLERSSAELLHEYQRLRITAYAADYFAALRSAAGPGISGRPATYRNVVLFLGSNIGNFDPDESRKFLREIRKSLRPDDVLLLGADLKKNPATLVAAYDDALGVTAAFNLNLLSRINRELDGDLNLASFSHRALYNEQEGRVESHLVSRLAQSATIRSIGLQVAFAQDETIHTESSYKFNLDQLSELARATGFKPERTWFDRDKRFSFNLWSAAAAAGG
jgi:dimethylhistidine N-methyltransferase